MKLEFIDITSYIGISSEAEHYYATVGDPKYVQENYVTMVGCDVTSGVTFMNQRKLRYFPSREEAEKLWQKDNGFSRDPFTIAHKADTIADLMEDGTARFPSIISIVKKAKEEFPDSVLCFSLNGNRNEFVRYLKKLDDRKVESIDDIVTILEQ